MAGMVVLGKAPWAPPLQVAMSSASSRHMISGVPIAAAGVVPYVELAGHGLRFMLQQNRRA